MVAPTAKDWQEAIEKRNKARHSIKEAKSVFEKATLARKRLELTTDQVQNDAFDVPEGLRNAFEAANPACEVCGAREGLHIHHAIPRGTLLKHKTHKYFHRLCPEHHRDVHHFLTPGIVELNRDIIKKLKKDPEENSTTSQ